VTTEAPPLLTEIEFEQLTRARHAGATSVECSLDLKLSATRVEIGASDWAWRGRRYPYPDRWKRRAIYYWDNGAFRPVARYSSSLIKLVPTEWGAPTFEIDGIKMLPTARVSPYADAENKVALIQPRGKMILDTCGGLGYFAAWCARGQARRICSFEKNPDVLWLRDMNPWSPAPGGVLQLAHADVTAAVTTIADGSFDAILHDPPRFGIAGELYSGAFYGQLARVLKRGGKLFHYTGAPNKLTSGRDVPREIMERLKQAGFAAARSGDGVLAVRT
jgi:predicted methyltransferase